MTSAIRSSVLHLQHMVFAWFNDRESEQDEPTELCENQSKILNRYRCVDHGTKEKHEEFGRI